jgi:hypothetical protein
MDRAVHVDTEEFLNRPGDLLSRQILIIEIFPKVGNKKPLVIGHDNQGVR